MGDIGFVNLCRSMEQIVTSHDTASNPKGMEFYRAAVVLAQAGVNIQGEGSFTLGLTARSFTGEM